MITKTNFTKDEFEKAVEAAGGPAYVRPERHPELTRVAYGILCGRKAKGSTNPPKPGRMTAGMGRNREMPRAWLDQFALHMTTQLRQVAQQSTIQRTNYQPKGALDRRRLTHALTGTSEFVRYRQDRTRGIDLSIYLSIDMSGSMVSSMNQVIAWGGSHFTPSLSELAFSTNYALREACFKLGISHKCIGWGGRQRLSGPATAFDVADSIYNTFPILPHYVGVDFPESNATIKVVNSWNQPRHANRHAMLAAMSLIGGGTPIHHAYPLPFEEMARSPRYEKHIIVFTDGQPGGRYGHRSHSISNEELFSNYGERAVALRKAFNVHTHTISLASRPSGVSPKTLEMVGWQDHPTMTDVIRDITKIISTAIRSTSKSLR
jgi:hypothetical protein